MVESSPLAAVWSVTIIEANSFTWGFDERWAAICEIATSSMPDFAAFSTKLVSAWRTFVSLFGLSDLAEAKPAAATNAPRIRALRRNSNMLVFIGGVIVAFQPGWFRGTTRPSLWPCD